MKKRIISIFVFESMIYIYFNEIGFAYDIARAFGWATKSAARCLRYASLRSRYGILWYIATKSADAVVGSAPSDPDPVLRSRTKCFIVLV